MHKNSTNQDLESLIDSVCREGGTHHHIPFSNTGFVRSFVKAQAERGGEHFAIAKYVKGAEMVHAGEIVDEVIKSDARFSYAHVPLGFIVKGSVIVLKGNKATKKLTEGDFIGLFETSDWLFTNRSRQIGDWTLVADSDTEILYFGAGALGCENDETSRFRSYLIELSREDHVPKPLTSLPLLDWVANHTTKSRISDCVIIVHTHLLPNSFALFRHLSSLVDFGKIYALEKPYSTVKSTVNKLVWAGFEVVPVKMTSGMPYEFAVEESVRLLWKKVLEDQKKTGFTRLLIVDDGADVWQSIPWESLKGVSVAGVEQTQRGIVRIAKSPFRLPPIVNVASSGVKKMVESEFIGQSVVKKLNEMGHLEKARQIGILGMGSIGAAVDRALRSLGKTPIFYDPLYVPGADMSEHARSSIDTLLNESDLLIGTTGTDSLKGTPFERALGDKVLASCSSANVEFSSLLKFADPSVEPFGTVNVTVHDGLTLHILNGGYPVNFDREKDSTPDEDIVVTRCLLYIGAMQAAELLTQGVSEQTIYNLDKISQKKLLERWIDEKEKLGQTPHITKDDIDTIVEFEAVEIGKDMPAVWQER